MLLRQTSTTLKGLIVEEANETKFEPMEQCQPDVEIWSNNTNRAKTEGKADDGTFFCALDEPFLSISLERKDLGMRYFLVRKADDLVGLR